MIKTRSYNDGGDARPNMLRGRAAEEEKKQSSYG